MAAQYPRELILAADTIVELDDHVLGKPADAAEARRILGMLSAAPIGWLPLMRSHETALMVESARDP